MDGGLEMIRTGFNIPLSSDGHWSGSSRKLRFTKAQLRFLEDTFERLPRPNAHQKSTLAMELGVQPRQVEVWFQNRRARGKAKRSESNCEVLRQRCQDLVVENHHLNYLIQVCGLTLSATVLNCPHKVKPTRSTLQIIPQILKKCKTLAVAVCIFHVKSARTSRVASLEICGWNRSWTCQAINSVAFWSCELQYFERCTTFII